MAAGSLLVLSLARALGQNFAGRLVSRKLSEKYQDLLRSKAPLFPTLVFLFPFFPDDMLCILAGLIRISFRRFAVIVLQARPWGLLFAIVRRQYREKAKTIEDIRRGILEVSSKEEPYDIFICYKGTDETGGRTIDSVIAQDVYNAVWAKNEWSRFLALMAAGPPWRPCSSGHKWRWKMRSARDRKAVPANYRGRSGKRSGLRRETVRLVGEVLTGRCGKGVLS